MSERACDRCGAQNPASAGHCWQCFGSFETPTVPGPARVGRIGPAAYGGTGVMTAPAPAPPHAAASPSSDWTRWVVKGVLFVVGFAGGWWAVHHFFFSGFPFPDQVAGQARVDTEAARDAAEAVASLAEILNVDVEMAFYGTEAQPAYVMFAFEVPEGLPLTGAPPFSQTGSGGIPFQCAPDAQGAGCVWEQDGTVVGVAGIGQTVDQLDPVARQVRSELAG